MARKKKTSDLSPMTEIVIEPKMEDSITIDIKDEPPVGRESDVKEPLDEEELRGEFKHTEPIRKPAKLVNFRPLRRL